MTLNPVVVPGDVKYDAVTANSSRLKVTLANGVLTLTPAAGATSGTTTVNVTATDFGGKSVKSTFSVTVTVTASTVSGEVFNDLNGNGKLTATTPGWPAGSFTSMPMEMTSSTPPSSMP